MISYYFNDGYNREYRKLIFNIFFLGFFYKDKIIGFKGCFFKELGV